MKQTLKKSCAEMREMKRKAGKKGGDATLRKYGREHFSKIGKCGADVFHARYRLEPVNRNDFAIVNRDTGEVKAFLNGLPF